MNKCIIQVIYKKYTCVIKTKIKAIQSACTLHKYAFIFRVGQNQVDIVFKTSENK